MAEELTELVAKIGENMNIRRARVLSVGNGVVATYVHTTLRPGLGKIGVLVAIEGAGEMAALETLGRQVGMHIAASTPEAVDIDGVDPAALEREKAVLIAQARESGRPENIIEKMVEGRIRKFYEEVVLLEQVWVHDGESRVKAVLAKAGVKLPASPASCWARASTSRRDRTSPPRWRRRRGCNAHRRVRHGDRDATIRLVCRRDRRHRSQRTDQRCTIDAMWSAIDRYAVVVFRDQRLSDAQLRDFAARFGPLEIGRAAARPGRRRIAIPQIGDISNLDVDNNVRALDDRRRLDSLGNRLWHTDASYMPVPVVLGMLHAVALPPPSPFGNGETEFADMRAAYDALPEARKQAIDDLVVEHDIFWSRGQIGFTEFPPASASNIRRRRSGWCACTGLEAQDTISVRARLAHRWLAGGGWPAAAVGPYRARDAAPFVYSHTWRVGDLVIWDNRCTMHRGRPHDELQPRDLRRATTLDTASTLDQAA